MNAFGDSSTKDVLIRKGALRVVPKQLRIGLKRAQSLKVTPIAIMGTVFRAVEGINNEQKRKFFSHVENI